MHHQPTTQTTLLHPLSASTLHPIPCILRLPPSSSCAPLDTPQHHSSQPSRILVPHSSLFIHPSCTPSPWHRHRARSPAAATTTFLYSPPRRHAGSTKRDCCYVALGDQQVSPSPSPSSSSSKTEATFRRSFTRSLSHHLSKPRFVFGSTNVSTNGNCCTLAPYFFTFDDTQQLDSNWNYTRESMVKSMLRIDRYKSLSTLTNEKYYISAFYCEISFPLKKEKNRINIASNAAFI